MKAFELHVAPLGDSERERLLGLAFSLAAAVDYKGGYRAHSQRVAEIAHETAQTLGISGDALFRLTIAGLLHDVGKLQIPDRILLKPSYLTDAEYEHIQRHPVLGHQVLISLGLPDEAKWVLHHHERGDGRGYPSGLIGAQIPFGARILLVADAWDSMRADRPYQAGVPFDAAASELRACAGTQFDTEVVEALLATDTVHHPPAGRG